jgi:hypothetical protein
MKWKVPFHNPQIKEFTGDAEPALFVLVVKEDLKPE